MFHTNICSIFFRYNNEIAIKREKIRQKQKLPPPPAKKIIPSDPNKASTSQVTMPPVSADDESSSSSHDQHSQEDEEITESLPPKEIPPSILNPKIDRIPAMQEFLTYLVSMDGGCRPKQASIENVRRVGKLLSQVQTTPSDMELLWDDVAMDVVRQRFFQNNNMAEKPRTVSTLRGYITALRLFYQFIWAKYRTLNRKGTKVLNEDLDKIKSCNVQLDGWLKTLAPAVHIRKAAMRKKDEHERLSKDDLKKLVNSEETKKITKEMLQLERKPVTAVSRDQFAKYRDNLIVRMLVKAAQRPGALANLTVEEFNNGVWDRTAEPALYTTQTFSHKTSSSEGEATLFWNETNYRLAKIYKEKIRPLIATRENAQLPPIPGAHNSRSAFFVTYSGKRLTGGTNNPSYERFSRVLMPRRRRQNEGLAYSQSNCLDTSRGRKSFRHIQKFGRPNDAPCVDG